MQEPKATKIGVIGGSRGLGSWLVRFFTEQGLEVYFTSADEQSQVPNNHALVSMCDVIFIAVPIGSMCDVLSEIYPLANGKTIVEVCSVKKFIIDHYGRLQAQHPEVKADFLSIHPMFGPMLRHLRGQVILFNYSSGSNQWAVALRRLLSAQQARCFDMDYLHHDEVMGVVQGLNHFNIFASAKTLNTLGNRLGIIRDVASPPYRIFLIFFSRYVLQDAGLYADIQMYNEFVPKVLDIFRQEVDALYRLITNKDRAGFIDYVATARGYFEENREDIGISNHLIEQLGAYLNKLK
ncbi:prephenate dehydrogenase/arogenate dehydrogenase family protein [Rhodoflexus sp.]